MEAAFDDYLRAGGDPEAYKTFLESASFRDAAVTLSTVRDEIEVLLSQGLPADQIYAALENALPGAAGENLGGFNLSDGYVNTTEGTTVGIEMFGAVDDLSIAIRRMEAEYGGAWLDSASIAFAVLISGPTRLVMEVGGDQLVQSLVGDQIDHVVESTANVMAGMAHHADHQQVGELVEYANEGFLTDEWTKETEHKLDTANDVDRTQAGATETIKFLVSTLIGVGGGKAVVVKYGPNDPPSRIDGDWSVNDMKASLLGHPPKGLGKPDLHHADQMPGSAIHEILPELHRGNKPLHPNKFNQGVTPEMRDADRKLHWWYRAREQGADDILPGWIYD